MTPLRDNAGFREAMRLVIQPALAGAAHGDQRFGNFRHGGGLGALELAGQGGGHGVKAVHFLPVDFLSADFHGCRRRSFRMRPRWRE